MNAYMQDVASHKLLTLEEEAELSAIILDPSRSKKAEAARAAAIERLVSCNLRLVVSISGHYLYDGISRSDLIQEGNIGLVVAAKRFDSKLGRFSTYASWWIKQRIYSHLRTMGHVFSLSSYAVSQIQKLRTLSPDVFRNDQTDAAELSGLTGIPAKRCSELLSVMGPTRSLDESWFNRIDKYDSAYVDYNGSNYVEDQSLGPDALLLEKENLEAVHAALATLPEQYRVVLERRFGLADRPIETLEAIGLSSGVTRERIRQIEGLALGLLRKRLAKAGARPF